jgi:hypothetical protein
VKFSREKVFKIIFFENLLKTFENILEFKNKIKTAKN